MQIQADLRKRAEEKKTVTITSSFVKRYQGLANLVVFILALLGLPRFARAQSYLTQVGDTTFRTTIPVEQGYFDASTGNLHIAIPLGTWPQRGSHTFSAALVYDSRIWYINNGTWQPTNIPNSTLGWRLVTSPTLGGSVTHNTQIYSCPCLGDNCKSTPKYYIYSNFQWTDAFGTVRAFPITTEYDPQNCDQGDIPTGSAFGKDASGYYMSVTNYTTVSSVSAVDGTQVFPALKDRNGNYFTSDSNGNIVDTLGRTPVTVTTNCNGQSTETCYNVLNSQGGRSTYTLTTETVYISTSFGQSGVTEYSGYVTAVQSIQLPDGTSYSFTYDAGPSGGYGELTEMILPTHGSAVYGFTTYSDAFGNSNRWLSTKTSSGNLWTYTPAKSSCGAGYSFCQQVLVTRPSGDTALYYFGSNAGSNGSWLGTIAYKNGSSNQQGFEEYTYTSGLTDVQKASHLTQPTDSGTADTNVVEYTYLNNASPLISKISEWNYYPNGSQPANPYRITTLSSYCDGAPGSVTVTDGTGSTTVAQTNTTFDSYGSGLISMSGITHHDDTNYGQTYTTRCNPTSISKLVNGTTYLTTSMTYDTTGQVRSATDPKGNSTSLDYTDNFYNDANPPSSYTPPAPTNAYLKTATLPIIGAETFGYYYGTGQVALSTDQNGAATTNHYIDSFSRPTEALFADGGWNAVSYPSQTEVNTYLGITNGTPSTSCINGCRHDEQTTDNFGRVNFNYLVSDPDGETTVGTTYDSNGRVASVTNPYRSQTNGQDSYAYDAMDRTTQVSHTDGTSVHVYYGSSASGAGGITSQLCASSTYGLGYEVLTVDEAGKKREIWTDGLGRTIEVDEPDANNNLTRNTCYAYDLNNNLAIVVSVTGQTRSYTYDDMSRVISVATPETNVGGTQYSTTFSYTNGGLCSGNPSAVCVRTNPTGATATYSYDGLNRVTQIQYSDGTPTVTYCYEGSNTACISGGYSSSNPKGRRTAMADGSGNCGWSYDTMGRIVAEQKTIAGVTKTISYAYNLDGSIASITYPTGRKVTYNVGNAERSLSAADSNGSQYALTASYAPMGALSAVIYGQTTGFGGTTESRAYNNRMELTSIQAASTNGTALNLSPCYTSFSFSGGCTGTTGNNGTVTGIVNSVDTSETQSYAYDNLNRISSAATQATSGNDCWGQTFGIDVVANLTSMSVTQCGGGPLSASTDGYNHLTGTGYSYDHAGNMTGDGSYTYSYDAESRITSVNGVNYSYDGDGLRVRKSSGTLYWRGISGDTLAESDLNGNISSEYVFFAGRRIARLSSGTVNYFYSDALGTVHTITDGIGHPCYDASFTPYGQEVLNPNISQTCSSTYKFTGYEYDSETGLYYAAARFYSWRLGRFMSVDPLGGGFANPQSFNRYAFSDNDSENRVDPNGQWSTSVHDEIIEAAFPGLDFSQIGILESASAFVDQDQSPEDSNLHSMCAPGQSLQDCADGTSSDVDNFISDAQALGYNDYGLRALGMGIHTMTDMASPWHTDANGTPRTWGYNLSALNHVFGEDTMPDIVGLVTFNHVYAVQIAQAILNAQATFLMAFPSQYGSAVSGWMTKVQNLTYAGLVAQTGSININPLLEAEVTNCLLGNPAACPDGGDLLWQSIITGGGEPDQVCLAHGGKCLPSM